MASIEYIAGFIDGEGSIQISKGTTHRSGKRMYYLRLSVHQVDRRPLDELVSRWGGSLRLIEKSSAISKKPIHEWVVTGTNAARVLSEIEPYLISKREQAQLGLLFQEGKGLRNSGGPVTDEVNAVREQQYAAMRALKN